MQTRLFLLGTFLLVLLTGCLGGNGEETTAVTTLGHETSIPQDTTTVLTCGTMCAQRAQCGKDADGNYLVLGGGGGPAVERHDRYIPADNPITIKGNELRNVRNLQNGEITPVNFYFATLNEDPNRAAWIAGWCVVAP